MLTFTEIKEISSNFTREHTFTDVLISPDLASLLFTLNSRNRNLNKNVWKKYAIEMKEGAWLKTGQTILVSSKGVLIDGQHRLKAIIESGISQVMTIIVGLPQEVFTVIDNGRPRTGIDTMTIVKPGINGRQAGIMHKTLRNIINFSLGKLSYHQGGKQKVNNSKLDHYYNNLLPTDKAIFEESLGKGRSYYMNSRNVGILGEAQFVFCYFILSKIDYYKANEFFDFLSTGQNLSKDGDNAPIYLLRDKLSEINKKKTGGLVEYKIAYLFKAWNFYINNIKIQRLLIRDGEEYPLPIGMKQTSAVFESESVESMSEQTHSVLV